MGDSLVGISVIGGGTAVILGGIYGAVSFFSKKPADEAAPSDAPRTVAAESAV